MPCRPTSSNTASDIRSSTGGERLLDAIPGRGEETDIEQSHIVIFTNETLREVLHEALLSQDQGLARLKIIALKPSMPRGENAP